MKTFLKDLLKYGTWIYGLLNVLSAYLPSFHVSAAVCGEVSTILAVTGAILSWVRNQQLVSKALHKAAFKFGYIKVDK